MPKRPQNVDRSASPEVQDEISRLESSGKDAAEQSPRHAASANPVVKLRPSKRAGLPATAEENKLASSLFGTSVVGQRGKETEKRRKLDVLQDERTGRESALDEDLFTIEGVHGQQSEEEDQSQESEEQSRDSDESASEDDAEGVADVEAHDSDGVYDSAEDAREGQASDPRLLPVSGRKPAWTDASLFSLQVPLAGPSARAMDGSFVGTKRLRKLRTDPDETHVSGVEYERRLREMYERLHPRPAWAKSAAGLATPSSSGALSSLLSRAGALVRGSDASKKQSRPGPLPREKIRLRRGRDANLVVTSSAGQEGASAMASVECIDWHPSRRTRLMLTASRDRIVRLFEIDGTTNPLLQSLAVPSLPLTHASFHPSGSSILLAGPRPYLYAYDLQSGRTIRSTPWRGGSAHSDASSTERDLSFARFQPTSTEAGESRLLAIGGRGGAVHLLDWGSGSSNGGAAGGGAGLVSTLRSNAPLCGMSWDKSTSADGRRLLTLNKSGTVHVWDVRSMKAEVEKRDVDLFAPKGLESNCSSSLWAAGSESGVVSVYDEHLAKLTGDAPGDAAQIASISPRKTIDNLKTRVSSMKWNHDGSILALASRSVKDALRLVHAPTLTVFSNWPTSGTPLGHVTDVCFSNASEYLAVANSRGKVLLYGLSHYSA